MVVAELQQSGLIRGVDRWETDIRQRRWISAYVVLGGGMDPFAVGAVLLAVVTGANEALGGSLLAGVPAAHNKAVALARVLLSGGGRCRGLINRWRNGGSSRSLSGRASQAVPTRSAAEVSTGRC